MIITPQMVLDENPCEEWTEERLKEKLGKGKTLLEILSMEDIDPDDRIWCVTRFLPEQVNRKFAISIARQCKTDVKEIGEYIDVIERYLNGEATDEELQAADSATDSAAYSAADCAAYWVADYAAHDAAYCAAYCAAYWAAYWAAHSGAYSAAYSNEMRKQQIKKLKELVRGMK